MNRIASNQEVVELVRTGALKPLSHEMATVNGVERVIVTFEVAAPCTGMTASWCPVHGSCICEPVTADDGFSDLDTLGCPLHSEMSDHAEGPVEA